MRQKRRHNPLETRCGPAVGTPTGCTSSSADALFGGDVADDAECFKTEKFEFFCAAEGSTFGVSNGRPSCGQPRCSNAVRVKASTSPAVVHKRNAVEKKAREMRAGYRF
jgi:hypothetical protein